MANSSSITLLKQNVIKELIDDPLIVKAIGSPDYDSSNPVSSGEDAENNYIFTWNRHPDNIAEELTFITLQVNINKYSTEWVKPTLKITIYSHNNHMNLNSEDFPDISSNRNDYLSQLIDVKLNGRTGFGNYDDENKINLISKLELTSNIESAYNDTFTCRRMIFETKDINASSDRR